MVPGPHVQKTYGITPEEFTAIMVRQLRRCPICYKKPRTKRLSVDHDHRSGFVRGLICDTCNQVLGEFRDDDKRFARAADYLRHPPAFDVVGQRRVPEGSTKKAPRRGYIR